MKGVIPDILDLSPNSYDTGIRMEKSIKTCTIIMEIFNLLYLVLLIYFDLNNRTTPKMGMCVTFFCGEAVLASICFRTFDILSEYDWYRINWEKQDLNQ